MSGTLSVMNDMLLHRWKSTVRLGVLVAALLPLSAFAKEITISMLDQGQILDQVTRTVLTQAYGKLDIAARFKERPATRALVESSSGMVDGELHRIAGLSSRFPQLLQVNVPVNWFDAVVISRTAHFTPAGWSSLRPYTMGYHRGIQAFERGTKGMKRDPAPTNELMLLKLQNGRTDIALMSDVEALELLAKMNDASLHILSPALERIQLFHYVHRKNAQLVPRLEAVLRQMAADGTIAAIRERALLKAGLMK
ncbi:MAG: transporter substrate-binding domain-containing protein [Pseudomonadota bacterium]